MRARNIKPGLFKNEILGAADPLYSLTFAGLWCLADRAGRLEDRPGRIHVEINPWRALADTERALDWLVANGFVVRYEVDGGRYLWIEKFTKHQHPHVNEKVSPLPAFVQAPESHQTSTVQAPESHNSAPSDSPIPDSPIPETLKPDSGFSDSGSPPTLDQIEKAKKVWRAPRHQKFNARDIATVAGVPIEAAIEAKRQIHQSIRRVQ